MKRVFFILFLTVLIFAKDNFVYETDNKELTERIDKIEKDLVAVKSEQKLSSQAAEEIGKNQELININSSKIAEIKTINSTNAQKISQIADSLSSIKNIMQEYKSKRLFEASIKKAEVKSEKPECKQVITVKNEDVERHSVMIKNLTDRVLILEKELKSIEQASYANEPKKVLYNYFDYFVIVTVALFFLMFIIIFILVFRTKRLRRDLNELLSPVKK